MSRTPLIVGNWKMFKTIQETVGFCNGLKQELGADEKTAAALRAGRVEAAVAPPFTAIAAAVQSLQGSAVAVAAQNVFWEESGAYTGEISPKMLAEAGCALAIVGHSERRQFFQETDPAVNKKTAALLKAGLTPIVCLGETLEEREKGATFQVVERQTRGGLQGLAVKEAADLVIAYEPVWAIGTGRTATPMQAEEVHCFLRSLLAQIFSREIAGAMRILYGGSVKPDNVSDLMAMENVDGGLVGGASLDFNSFARLLRGVVR